MAHESSKTLVIGLVTLMAMTAAFVAIPVMSDESSATTGAGTADDPYTYVQYPADLRSEIWVCIGCVFEVVTPFYEYTTSADFGLVWNQAMFTGAISKVGDFTIRMYSPMFGSESVLVHAVYPPIGLNVSDMTVAAGDYVMFTPVTDPSVSLTISGVTWLTVTQNVVSGIAPSTTGEYQVTVSAGSSSATFTITVISKLAPTNPPTSGVIVFPR